MYDYAVAGMGKRLIFSFIFTLALFLLENTSLFAKSPTGIFNSYEYPYLHIGISLGLLLLCAICAYEQIYHGIRSIALKYYSPESVCVVATSVSLIHSTVAIILVSCGYENIGTFNFVPAAILLGTILFSYVNVALPSKYELISVSSEPSVSHSAKRAFTEFKSSVFSFAIAKA